MRLRRIGMTIATIVLAGIPAAAVAQFPPPPPPPGSAPSAVQDRWPEPPKPLQAAPQPRPQAPAQPASPARRPQRPAQAGPDGLKTTSDGDVEPLPPKPTQRPAAAANVITCSGVFAKDSTHLKLAMKYDSRNVVYGDVDGPDGSKIKASILFPNDPRRRLEVLWSNEASRSDTQVIAINGKSQWAAPKGLKLGLGIAALEKLNRKPFKLSGFGADNSASVLGWEGGALSSLPGGCKVGIRLMLDAKSPPDARSALAADKEFLSNDAGVRAVKPTVGEILIGY